MAVAILESIGKYNILENLGRGAKSTLYKVQDSETGQVYTLKRVLKESDDDYRYFEQAETEYEVSRRFTNPYLRKSLELHKIKKWLKTNELQLLMEFVDGITVKQAHLSKVDEIINIFTMVAQGLGSLHDLGFVHADIKPKNILLVGGDGIKIIDFGQSCPMGHQKLRIQGTPDYMAPEQVDRSFLDQRTDIFSYGATLYEVLTGAHYPTKVRATNDGGTELTAAPNVRDIPTPVSLNPQVPASLSKLVMDCCANSPKERPENMREVISRLEVAMTMFQRQKSQQPATDPVPEPIAQPKPPQQNNDDYDDDSGEFERFIESIL
jgi:serine/threonine-protein kinase